MNATLDNRAIIGGVAQARASQRKPAEENEGLKLLSDCIGLCVFLFVLCVVATIFEIGW